MLKFAAVNAHALPVRPYMYVRLPPYSRTPLPAPNRLNMLALQNNSSEPVSSVHISITVLSVLMVSKQHDDATETRAAKKCSQ